MVVQGGRARKGLFTLHVLALAVHGAVVHRGLADGARVVLGQPLACVVCVCSVYGHIHFV